VARWPGKIPAGSTCTEFAATIDVLPTLAKLAGSGPPADRIIDGRDIWPLLSGQPGAKTPHESFYYYWDNGLEAIRSGPWKLHLPHAYRTLDGPAGHNGQPGPYKQAKTELALYNLAEDVGESKNVAAEHQDKVDLLLTYAEKAKEDLGDSLTKREGKNRRPAGQLK
jgi:arylsulfatase A-like enzyme